MSRTQFQRLRTVSWRHGWLQTNEAEPRRKRDYMCYSHNIIDYNMGALYCVLYMEDHYELAAIAGFKTMLH
jgi:hypothetical protein